MPNRSANPFDQDDSRFDAESRLLLALLRRSLVEGEASAADLFASARGVDYQRLLWLIGEHGVAGYLPASLEGAPTLFVEALAARRRAARLRALAASAELVRLLERFGRAGVRVMPLKGPVLSDQLFGDLALRGSADLDLLVEEGALPEVERLLGDGGYRPFQPFTALGPRHLGHLLRVENERGFRPPAAGGAVVDLHWRLFQDPGLMPLSFDRLWAMAGEERFQSVTVRRLEGAPLTAYLCAHGTVSCWFKLKWLCDVVPLFDELGEEEGARLMATAADLGVGRCVAHGALLAERLLGARIPEGLRAQRRRLAGDLRFLERSALEPIFSQQRRGTAARLRQMLFKASLYRGPKAWTAVVARGWVPVRHYRLMALPDGLFALRFALAPLVHGWQRLRRMGRGRGR